MEPRLIVVLSCALACTGCGRVAYELRQGDAGAEADAGADAGGGRDAGPPTGCDRFTDALLCDGFESGDAMWLWSEASDGNEVGIDASRTYLGAGALHARTTAPDRAWWLTPVFDDITMGEAWLRGYVYIPAAVALQKVTIFTIIDGAAPFSGATLEIVDGGRIRTFNTGGVGASPSSEVSIDRDRWVCLRMRVVVGDAGLIEVFLDDTRVVSQDADTLPESGLDNVHIGLYVHPEQTEPAELWLDEVIADTAPIPCD